MFNIIIFILVIILFFISLIFFKRSSDSLKEAKKIRISKNSQQEVIEKQFKDLYKKYNQAEIEYQNILNKKNNLLLTIKEEEQAFEEIKKNRAKEITEQVKLYEKNASYAKEQYIDRLEKGYEDCERECDEKIKKLKEEYNKYEEKLNKIKNSLTAGIEASLREQEKEKKIDFYKLTISQIDLQDIIRLENVKLTLNHPIILSKLIWSTYFQKQTVDLCNRVFGVNTICGIYKITDLITKQCYIGQSVNCQDRMKSHIKCGLGIDASSSNKLYNTMQRDGVWNFTFELLEKCPRNQLDEKERYWISMYQSDKFGLNTTKGNK